MLNELSIRNTWLTKKAKQQKIKKTCIEKSNDCIYSQSIKKYGDVICI